MKVVRFEAIAITILVAWIVTAVGTLASLTGIPVIPSDAPVVFANEVVISQQHASVEAPAGATVVAMNDVR